ncbi:hypothetical protein [Endozoicomonas lisbonensis]|uniref:Uncharacterized protein n=1 Tax=Endozoicomonas lisbonensis TaxID=3120522 RepID=A0ABV2SCU5_9GAMM
MSQVAQNLSFFAPETDSAAYSGVARRKETLNLLAARNSEGDANGMSQKLLTQWAALHAGKGTKPDRQIAQDQRSLLLMNATAYQQR